MKYWWARYNSEDNVLTKPLSGQPNALNLIQERDILEEIENDPFLTAMDLSRRHNVSHSTVRRFLIQHGIHCRIAAYQTKLTDDHKINRIAFCETLLEKWRRSELNSIIFSDEKTFCSDLRRQKKCYRPINQRHTEKYVSTVNLSGRISAAYWGAISINGLATDIVKINGKFNSDQYLGVLQNYVVPAMHEDDQRIYMHDNSPVHTAHRVQEFLNSQQFKTMFWSPLSPDLNPIENVWSYLTFNWPEMEERSVAALDEMVTSRWNELYGKRGSHIL